MGLAATKLMALAPKVGAALLSAGSDAVSGFDVTSIMADSVNTVQGQVFSILAVVVPSIVLITGAVVGVKFGVSWLRKIKG